jgi:nitrite reductase (NO-forming) / hydroxylamine reductase
VAVSGDGKYVIGGGYWPPHFVILDASTMEPLKVVSARGVNVDGEYVNEARVAAIYDTPHASSWLVNIKELGQTWQVDYSDLDNLRIDMIDNSKYLHDGFFDPTGRYFQIAANASDQMVVIDSQTRKLEAIIDTDVRPHPGPGANWNDPHLRSGGWHAPPGRRQGDGLGQRPGRHKDQAWKICYEVETDGPGLFIRTHPKSDYIWADQTLHPEPEVQQSIKVIDKKTREVVKTIQLTDDGRLCGGALRVQPRRHRSLGLGLEPQRQPQAQWRDHHLRRQDAGGKGSREGLVRADRQVQRV